MPKSEQNTFKVNKKHLFKTLFLNNIKETWRNSNNSFFLVKYNNKIKYQLCKNKQLIRLMTTFYIKKKFQIRIACS